MIWGGLFGQYPKIEQNGVVPFISWCQWRLKCQCQGRDNKVNFRFMLISIFHFESQNQAKYQKRGYIKMVDSSKFSDVMLQRRNAIRSFCQHHSQHHSWRPAHYLLSLTLSKSKSKLQSAVERYQNPSQENVGGRLQYERWLRRPSRKVVPLDHKNITNITNSHGTWSQEH